MAEPTCVTSCPASASPRCCCMGNSTNGHLSRSPLTLRRGFRHRNSSSSQASVTSATPKHPASSTPTCERSSARSHSRGASRHRGRSAPLSASWVGASRCVIPSDSPLTRSQQPALHDSAANRPVQPAGPPAIMCPRWAPRALRARGRAGRGRRSTGSRESPARRRTP